MEKRMKYRTYKKAYPDAPVVEGSWDPETKTVVVRLPDGVKHLKFSSKEWETSSNRKRMRGHNITIVWWGEGAEAHFWIEAYEVPEEQTKPGFYHSPSWVEHYIPGYGPNARDAAIKEARELAATGKYRERWIPL